MNPAIALMFILSLAPQLTHGSSHDSGVFGVQEKAKVPPPVNTPPKVEPAKPVPIPDAEKNKILLAQRELLLANSQMEQARNRYASANQSLINTYEETYKTMGISKDDYQIDPDKLVANPLPPKPPATPKEEEKKKP